MNRRTLLPLLFLAACSADPAANYLGGVGDPVAGAALSAPSTFGDLSKYQGDPAGAARAVVQLEFLTDAFENNPVWAPQANPILQGQLQQAEASVRQQLGIGAGAPAQDVIDGLRAAAQAIDDGSNQRAQLALSAPAFTAGGAETLRRLSNMRSTTMASVAAQAVSQAAMEGPSGPGGRRMGTFR